MYRDVEIMYRDAEIMYRNPSKNNKNDWFKCVLLQSLLELNEPYKFNWTTRNEPSKDMYQAKSKYRYIVIIATG